MNAITLRTTDDLAKNACLFSTKCAYLDALHPTNLKLLKGEAETINSSLLKFVIEANSLSNQRAVDAVELKRWIPISRH